MLGKLASLILIALFLSLACPAQTAPFPAENTRPKLTRDDFLKTEIVAPDYEKELFKPVKRQNKLSGTAKTALWIGLFAAGVITVVVLATTLGDDEQVNSPCGGGVRAPCPPGCVCIQ